MSDPIVPIPHAAAKGDDRNLVPAELSPALALEDRVFLFWKNYRTPVIALIVAAVAATIGWESYKAIQAGRNEATSAAYGAASTVEAKRAFAREHAGHPLANLALLEVADDSFRNARYEDAAREYASAAAALTEPLFRGRARLGEGIAATKAGQTAKGEQLLTAIAEDTTAMMAFRTQAYYELAAFAVGTGEKAKARDTVDKLRALDPEGYWANQGTALRVELGVDEAPAAP